MILGQFIGGVIPGGLASATPILIPAQPFPVVLSSLLFSVVCSGAAAWDGVVEWLDGEGNSICEVFAESQSVATEAFHSFRRDAWRPAQSTSMANAPLDMDNDSHSTWCLPVLPVLPGERVRLRTIMATPGEATLSSIRYRFERVSFRRD